MTHIRGDILKVYEVLKKGYPEPIVQTTHGYSLNTGAIAPGVHNYDVTSVGTGNIGFIKKISITCNNAAALHEWGATRISVDGTEWTFIMSFFFIGDEWSTGDVIVGDTQTLRITIINTAAGNVTFAINVYWIESPIV